MSVELFDSIQCVFETEIIKFNIFLQDHIADYDFAPANIEFLCKFVEEIKAKLTQDIGKSFEEAIKMVLVPTWKTIFEADNYIDTGKTLKEQETIIASLLDSLNKTGFIDNTYLPDHIVDIMNRDFLKDKYKQKILIAELSAEYNLCNPQISWIDANTERIRVAFYSGLFAGNLEKIEELVKKYSDSEDIEKLETFTHDIDALYDYIQDHRNSEKLFNTVAHNPTEPEKMKETIQHYIDKIPDISLIMSKNDLKIVLQTIVKEGLLPTRKVNMVELASAIVLICIGVAPCDDWMDLSEDIENNKITGITKAVSEGIDPKHIISTVIAYLNTMRSNSVIPNAHAWYTELAILMYQDIDKCLEFCKSVSPYLFEVIFQRK